MDKNLPADTAKAPRSHAGKLVAFCMLLAFITVYLDLFACRKVFSHDAAIWYGTFHYYVQQLQDGVFPYWDPYAQMGTYFYPAISGYGLLDPVVLICVLLSKLFSISPFTLFIYFRIYRILFFCVGAFLLFRSLSRNGAVAAYCAGILLFTVTRQNAGQPMMDYCYTVPAAMHLMLLLLDNIQDRRRYGYAFGLALLTGITMNVFVPALSLFALALFALLLPAIGRASGRTVLRELSRRSMLICAALCVALVLLMAAPPLSVYYRDVGADGELFALGKLTDSNNGRFKAMTASDFGGDRFFDTFRQNRGTFLSRGSLLSLVLPDHSLLRFRPEGDTAPSISLYLGIIPVVLLAAGVLHSRNRMLYAALAMAGVVLIASYNPAGVLGEYTGPQRVLNSLFPPLKMLDTRLNFASLLSFFLSMALCLSLSALLQGSPQTRSGLWDRYRILIAAAAVTGAKAAVNILYNGVPIISAWDTVVMALPVVLAVAVLGVRAGLISRNKLMLAALLLTVADLAGTGARSISGMRDGQGVYAGLGMVDEYRQFSIAEADRSHDDFVYFRLPYVPGGLLPLTGYVEDIAFIKSAFPNNADSAIFTTKRYYDLFSQALPERQFAVNGIRYPIIRFFPAARAEWVDGRRSMLDRVRNDASDTFRERLLLEREATEPPAASPKFDELPDVEWFESEGIGNAYEAAIPEMKVIRQNAAAYVYLDEDAIAITRFTTNELGLAIRNGTEGFLLYADGWSKYWKATVDGQEVPLIIANYNSKALRLPPGEHQVLFVFDPVHYRIALVLFYCGVIGAAAPAIFFAWRSRTSNPGESGPGGRPGP